MEGLDWSAQRMDVLEQDLRMPCASLQCVRIGQEPDTWKGIGSLLPLEELNASNFDRADEIC